VPINKYSANHSTYETTMRLGKVKSGGGRLYPVLVGPLSPKSALSDNEPPPNLDPANLIRVSTLPSSNTPKAFGNSFPNSLNLSLLSFSAKDKDSSLSVSPLTLVAAHCLPPTLPTSPYHRLNTDGIRSLSPLCEQDVIDKLHRPPQQLCRSST